MFTFFWHQNFLEELHRISYCWNFYRSQIVQKSCKHWPSLWPSHTSCFLKCSGIVWMLSQGKWVYIWDEFACPWQAIGICTAWNINRYCCRHESKCIVILVSKCTVTNSNTMPALNWSITVLSELQVPYDTRLPIFVHLFSIGMNWVDTINSHMIQNLRVGAAYIWWFQRLISRSRWFKISKPTHNQTLRFSFLISSIRMHFAASSEIWSKSKKIRLHMRVAQLERYLLTS